MPITKYSNLLLLLFTLIYAAQVLQDAEGSRTQVVLSYPQKLHQLSPSDREVQMQDDSSTNLRRLMIGSVAPSCTYNECRGCKYKCRAEQVPVEGNDPMNSAYRYKCVCHRKNFMKN